MNRRKLILFTLGIALAACVALAAGRHIAGEHENAALMDEMQAAAYATSTSLAARADDAGTTDVATSDATMNLASASATTVTAVQNTIDFKTLQASNPDIFAWIKIPDTKLDYPVCQHPSNDSYYLKHGVDGRSSEYGCPYIELSDSKNLMQFNTVMYGHNMNNGSMFAALHKYEDQDFFNNHRQITVYTPDHVYTYTVFAAVMYSDKHIPYYFDDNKKADREAFLASLKTDIVKSRSINMDDMNVTEQDVLLTLSTCDKKLRDKRFMVVSVLTELDGVKVR